MRCRRSVLPILLALGAPALAACDLIAGIKDVELAPTAGSSAVSAASSGSSASSAASSGTTGGAPSTTGGTGGDGGAPSTTGGAGGDGGSPSSSGSTGGDGGGGEAATGTGTGGRDDCVPTLEEGAGSGGGGGGSGSLRLGETCLASSACRSGLCEVIPTALGGRAGKQCVGIPRASFVTHNSPDDGFPAEYVVAVVHDGVRVHAVGFDDDLVPVGFELDDDDVWVGSDVPDLPPAGQYAGVAHDPGGIRSWVFGLGVANPGVWEWDGITWTALDVAADPETDNEPAAFANLGLGFDPVRGLLVVYGGDENGLNNADGELDQVFAIDPTGDAGVWQELADGPGRRRGHSLAFDRDSCSLLAVGGQVQGLTREETHGFVGDQSWPVIGPTVFPGARIDHHAIVDPLRERIVMMGGVIDGGTGRTDAWEWIAGRWVETVPMGGGGPDDTGGRAVYDPVNHRVVYVENSLADPDRWFEYTTLGTPCLMPQQCASGSCVDGVCCDDDDCADQVCNSSAQPGTCAAADP